ncbi:hypothetical protein JXQ70_08680 [bacterium]|nr:hypothetical protein [bacterium]
MFGLLILCLSLFLCIVFRSVIVILTRTKANPHNCTQCQHDQGIAGQASGRANRLAEKRESKAQAGSNKGPHPNLT